MGTSVTKAGFCMNQAGNDVIDIHTSEDMENTPLWSWMQFHMNFTSGVISSKTHTYIIKDNEAFENSILNYNI